MISSVFKGRSGTEGPPAPCPKLGKLSGRGRSERTGKVGRCQGAPGFVRSVGVVSVPPALDVEQRIAEGEERVCAQEFVAELAIEAFDVAVLNRLTGLNEVELDAVISGPDIEGATPKLAAIVQRHPFRFFARRDHRVEGGDHRRTRQTVGPGDREAVACATIDQGEAVEPTSGAQLIAHEVDAPCLIRSLDHGARHARHRQPLPGTPPHGQPSSR